jgi:hypothetical protein
MSSVQQQQETSIVRRDSTEIMEKLITTGDLSKLTPAERVAYYQGLCESLDLNWRTRPFEYLTLSGKLVLYARKDAAEQLRKKQGISIDQLDERQDGDLFVVTAHARTPDGREDMDMGAVSTLNLKGDALVNARLKAVTKAKRRVTLSICGLGMLDESEIETIPRHAVSEAPAIEAMSARELQAAPETSEAIKSEDVEARKTLVEDIMAFCGALNGKGDLAKDAHGKPAKWTAQTLRIFVNEEFKVKDGLVDLSIDDLKKLQGILSLRLDAVL